MPDRATLEAATPSCGDCPRKCVWVPQWSRWECTVHGPQWSSQMAGRVQEQPHA